MLGIITRAPLAPNPAPTSVTVNTGAGLLSHIPWGVVGACVIIAIIVVAAWNMLKEHPVLLAVVVLIVLAAGGFIAVNTHAFGGR